MLKLLSRAGCCAVVRRVLLPLALNGLLLLPGLAGAAAGSYTAAGSDAAAGADAAAGSDTAAGADTAAAKVAPGYIGNPEAVAFIDEVSAKHGFDPAQLAALFADAQRQQSIIDAISRPAERTLDWGRYSKIFIKPERISQGVDFWQANRATLARAEETYGVPAAVVVAIIGVETFYGRHRGKYRVLDALATLAFDYPPRAKFFRQELEQFLLLAREEGKTANSLLGSYAGAMGYGQFISSSYRAYAVDFDQDGVRDIWNNPVDAIGSVANYLARHGWQPDASAVTLPVYLRPGADAAAVSAAANAQLDPRLDAQDLAKLGLSVPAALPVAAKAALFELVTDGVAEQRLGLDNFYVITRYNHSHLYAMAVWELAQAIAAADVAAG